MNELSAVFEVGVPPVKGAKSDAKWGESTEGDEMEDGVRVAMLRLRRMTMDSKPELAATDDFN